MSLLRNTRYLLNLDAAAEERRVAVEYHLLSHREIYDATILTADRYSSHAARWAVRGRPDSYTVRVISHPYYHLPQDLCLSFDCFTQTEKGKHGVVSWLPAEQVALDFLVMLSLFAREALVPLGVRREDNEPIAGSPHRVFPRREHQAKPPEPCALNSAEFFAVLEGIAKAPPVVSQAVGAAMKFYHAALTLRDFDPSVAYVSLVSAVECLAGAHFEGQKFDFEALPKFEKPAATLQKIAAVPGAAGLVDELKQQLLDREFFSRKRFVQFLEEFVTREFWETPDPLFPDLKEVSTVTIKNFVPCVKDVYDARSKFVHGGAPFPDYVEFGLRVGHPAHIMGDLFSLFERPRFVPLLAWFEHLCHTTITEYMRRVVSPELGKKQAQRAERKEALLRTMANLPNNTQASLKNLVHWTARFLGAAVGNPLAPNAEWADSAETVNRLAELGIIGTEGAEMHGSSWLKDRAVGETAGEFVFGGAKNPFRGNEILLPEGFE